MAARFWVGGTGTWDASATTHWAASSGGASGASAPTSADDVTIDSASTGGTITIASGAACNNLTVTWTAAKTNILSLSANFAPAGAISINGPSAVNRILMQSSVPGTARTVTVGSAPTLSNVSFSDISSAGAGGTWSGTIIENCGGNSGITMTPAATQTNSSTTSYSWSDVTKWTSRVPLAQDDVIVNGAFSASQTITMDMPRMGKSITFNCTGNPNLAVGTTAMFFSSLTMATGMTVSGSTMTWAGRSASILTSNGVTFTMILTIQGPGATLTLADAFTNTGARLNLVAGTFNDGGFSVSVGAVSDGVVGVAAALVMSTTWSITGTDTSSGVGNVWRIVGGAPTTITPGASTAKFTDASSSTKTFAGGGKTYNNIWWSGAGTGVCQMTGSNTFADFKADTARNLQFTAGTTTTAATWHIDGCTIGSITAAGHTLAKSGGGKVKASNVTVSRSTGSPALTFYDITGAGGDGGNNVQWQFYNPDYSLAVAAAAFTFAAFSQRLLRGLRVKPITTAFAMTRYAPRLIKAWRVNVGAAAFTFAASSVTVREVVANSHYIVRGGARRRSINATRTRTVS